MKTLRLGEAASAAISARPDRPATGAIHDSPDARLVVFSIRPGQHVPPHRSTSTVVLIVTSGSGVVSGSEGERAVQAGDAVVYEPNELHGMRADRERLELLAVIAPRPAGR